jgi:hypothetical protein
MAEVQKKRNDLTIKEKLDILERYDKLPKMSQRKAAVQLKISQPLLCTLLKKRDAIQRTVKQNENLNCKRNRSGKDDQVESALKLWFTNVREHDARVDGPLMRQKAEELAKNMGKDDFVATEGWFHRWRKRENIVYKHMHGEQKDANFLADESWIEGEWPKIVYEFLPRNVYSVGEAGLYYRALPEHICSKMRMEGYKTSKQSVTVSCCACTYVWWQRERLLVIGTKQEPKVP